MEKLGNTPFDWERLDIQMDENIFIPMKTLNETRRQALEALEQELTKPFKRAEAPHVSLKTGQKNKKRTENLPIYVSCEDLDTARSLYKREGIRGMYLPFSVMEKCLEQGLEQGLEMYLATPHIMRGKLPQGFLETAGKWLKQGMTGFLVRSLEAFAALKSAGLADKCVLDHSMYTWNDRASAFWEEQKVMRNTVPVELNEGEIRHRDNRHSEMLIYGYLPLMISAQCVHKNLYGCNHKEEWVSLKDRYEKEFPAVCYCNPWKMENTGNTVPCYNIIYNSIPYGLLKEKEQVERLGLHSLRISFTTEKAEQAVRIFEEFKGVYLDGANPPKRDYTKGHFKRGAE